MIQVLEERDDVEVYDWQHGLVVCRVQGKLYVLLNICHPDNNSGGDEENG